MADGEAGLVECAHQRAFVALMERAGGRQRSAAPVGQEQEACAGVAHTSSATAARAAPSKRAAAARVGRLQGRISLISLSFPRARRATDGHAERIRTKSLHVPKTSYFLM